MLFLLALISALLTYNVYRPAYSGLHRSVFSFFLGMATGEYAPHSIALQAFLAILLISNQALAGLPGQLGILILIGSWAGLAMDYKSSLSISDEIEKAMRAGLGEDYYNEIEDKQKDRFSNSLDWWKIIFPLPVHHPKVVRQRDICYSRVRGLNLRLDVYRHVSLPPKAPSLVQIHGGGWVVGSKNEQGLPLMNHMAARGWTGINVNYRLSPHATFPEHLIDLKQAIRWIRENHEQYGVDPDFIVVTGGSAGGHLSALLALTANEPEFQPGFEKTDTSVRGCIPFYGIYDFTNRHNQFHNKGMHKLLEHHIIKASQEEAPEAYRKASPVDWINDKAPPFLVIHGTRDSLAPVEEAILFTQAFRNRASAPLVYLEIPGAQHAFELLSSPKAQAAINGAERFLAYLYSKYLTSLKAVS